VANLLQWQGRTAVVVGSGPSAATTPLELTVGRAKMIAVNSSWRLVPWADVLYACDAVWWFHHNGAPDFPGHKYTSSPVSARKFGLELFNTTGSNSGLRAIRLAEKFGAMRILLVGFDMHVAGGVHWHDPHTGKMRNPGVNQMTTWRGDFERSLRHFRANIINCTPGSALKCFPFQPFFEAIDGGHSQARSDQPRHCSLDREQGSAV
jgi:hypothetical protein